MKTFKEFLDSIAGFAGKTAASYHAYYDRENAAARENAKIAYENYQNEETRQAMAALVQQYYYVIAEILFHSILNTCAATHIAQPRNMEVLFSAPQAGKSQGGYFYLIYRGIYDRRRLNIYGITRGAIERILQDELDNVTGIYGFFRLKIFVEFSTDGKIIFRVAAWSDVMNAIREII